MHGEVVELITPPLAQLFSGGSITPHPYMPYIKHGLPLYIF